MSTNKDWCTKWGAEELRLIILNYWHKRGYDKVRLHRVIVGKFENDTTAWGIRSNLVNGLPPKN